MALCVARPKFRFVRNPSRIQLFSASSSDSPPPQTDDASAENPSESSPSSPSQSSFSSYFSDVKASLKQKQQQKDWRPNSSFAGKPHSPSSFSPSNNQSSGKVASLDEIRRNLAGFRRSTVRSPTDSNPGPTQPQPFVSMQELYKRNVLAKSGDLNSNTADSGIGKGGKASFDAIRESLKQMKPKSNAPERKGSQPFSLSAFSDSLKIKPDDNARSTVIGGTEALPISVFGKEMEERETGKEDNEMMMTEFLKLYSPAELGMKLRELRPETKEEGWFSLHELNERLIKLREMEVKATDQQIHGLPYNILRSSLKKMKMSEDEKKKKASEQRRAILTHLGGTPTFMLHPPKEHLVEKYFHPDNMSSEEKMKLELAKVREEFKMSESDCGSFRVQVALLTTKIKHLSSVLHKKDKHSRKGLQAMVQKRKKMLKYLRRTDWDSYCLVLSKLGLRDNPDYKN